MATSPDGLHVYVAAIRDGAVAVFARDGTTGALTFVEAKKQGLGGIDGLAGASSVVVAPDGGQVYVAGSASDAVVTFQRDASTGALSLFDVRRPEPLVAPVALAIAGNGEHLYAGDAHTNGAPGGIVVFEREEATGALHFDGWFVPAADWISGPSALRVSADGEYLYDADAADALVVSRRDVMEGDLAPVERQQNGTVGASSVAVSPDDRHVYVAAHEGTIAVFRHRVVCSAAPQAACRRPIRSGKGSIHLANLPADDRNLIKWKWRAGAATSFAAFGNHDNRLCDLCLRRLQYRRRRAERPGPRRRHLRRDVVRTLLEDGWDARFPLQRQARNPRRDHADLPPCGRRRTSARDRVRKLRQLAARCSAVCTAGDGAAPGVQR